MSVTEFVNANWPYLAIAFAIVLLIGWFIMRANRKATVVRETMTKDVLDEGAERASRNQALIDAAAPAPTLSDMEEGAQASQNMATPQAATADGDDLTRIKGLGPKIANLLNDFGINRFAQIADWDDAKIDEIDAKLGRFQGRIRRDAWVDQAKLLSSQDESGFTSRFGQNG